MGRYRSGDPQGRTALPTCPRDTGGGRRTATLLSHKARFRVEPGLMKASDRRRDDAHGSRRGGMRASCRTSRHTPGAGAGFKKILDRGFRGLAAVTGLVGRGRGRKQAPGYVRSIGKLPRHPGRSGRARRGPRVGGVCGRHGSASNRDGAFHHWRGVGPRWTRPGASRPPARRSWRHPARARRGTPAAFAAVGPVRDDHPGRRRTAARAGPGGP
jgi:hypothetical protein